MEENKDYKVYRFDYLTEGSQLKFEHSVYCEDVDISSLITQGADALEALRQDSMDGEQKGIGFLFCHQHKSSAPFRFFLFLRRLRFRFCRLFLCVVKLLP